MNWFYVEAGQQCGPVSDEQLQEFVRAGKVMPTTLVWRDGLKEWQPYSAFQPAGASALGEPPVLAPDSSAVVCAECGRSFAPSDVIRIHNTWICGGCKPVFLQRMVEGAPL